ncbi:hypothetical protein AA0119_g12550 [Alternaria tenuissima]|jgi:hypothetical protein|uniref:Uncharacterized protein n=1 Tax=Alternaria tenuissima TaxID=119927 RepID=A0ABY0FTD9_9PLEO|nr:hypothetical protein AA0119_g12550 [Alternaria tenuissima]RYO11716.1 hypothetical protein AA0121_g9723 [Alternaria tenuissima]
MPAYTAGLDEKDIAPGARLTDVSRLPSYLRVISMKRVSFVRVAGSG